MLLKLRWWLSNDMYEFNGPDWMLDFMGRFIEEPGLKLLCKLFSHSPVVDMCNMPEHDYCAWCRKSMPGAALRKNSNE